MEGPSLALTFFKKQCVLWSIYIMYKLKNTITLIVVLCFFSSGAIAELPDPGMTMEKGRTAIVITDPQVDFLSPDGVAWGLVGKSVVKNGTVNNIDSLMKIAGEKNIPLVISPHYYSPTAHDFQHGGALEVAMHNIKMFEGKYRPDQGAFTAAPGADWMPQYKKYIDNKKTVVANPHKIYGPDSNDTVLQLRKRGIDKIILAGMSANLCTESHLREFMEQGFEVMVVIDATAAAQLPGYDGYAAAVTNTRMIANTVKTTAEAIKQIKSEL